ncbi:MAG: type II CRISPR-associated endonuclease Cas1 [Emcibacter sp.]|nr:type II CRISPR-associated endonuclease Cas1 [Emcibacter sp.]
MVTQVVEIAADGNYLSKYRGFMTIKRDDVEIGRVPLDDITVLILSAHQITLSKTLIAELALRKAPIMVCGKNYHPLSFSLPYDNHFDQTGILWAQIDCGQPLMKRLWQSVVREKINNQAVILEYFKGSENPLQELSILIKRVKSGDPENMEAQAARHYWPALFGSDFRRDRETGAGNTLLNYGYSILRAATARAICGAGLTPALGIHHHNRKNPFALVDDLMEPYRPLVDMAVRKIIDKGEINDDPLTPDIKKDLAKILDSDVRLEKGVSTVMNSMHRLAQTFVTSLHEKENKLEFPKLIRSGNLF